jgi:hypothetical protein
MLEGREKFGAFEIDPAGHFDKAANSVGTTKSIV